MDKEHSEHMVQEPARKYQTTMSAAEYLSWERGATTKHEYAEGTLVSMAGASPKHNLILSNLIASCHAALKDTPCRIYPSDLRVLVKSKEAYFYPDASIICGEPELSDEIKDTVKNPSVILEILSPTTEEYDLGKKFFFYMQIAALQEYITIDSSRCFVRAGRRQADNAWKFEEYTQPDDRLSIHTVSLQLPLSDLYAGV
jgi:Uma2 family endonuclease